MTTEKEWIDRITRLERQLSDHEKRISELEAPPAWIRSMSKVQRDQVKEVVDTIALLSEKGDGQAYIPDLVAVLSPRISLGDIAEITKNLKYRGEIFEPRRGYLEIAPPL